MLSGMGWVAVWVEKLGDVGLLLVGLGMVMARLWGLGGRRFFGGRLKYGCVAMVKICKYWTK